MVLPWFLAIQFATDGEFVKGAVGKDLRDKLVTASEGHGGLPGYHLLHLATHFFPATLFLIPGVVSVVKRFRQPGAFRAVETGGLRVLIAWAVPTHGSCSSFCPPSSAITSCRPIRHWRSSAATALRMIEGLKLPVSRAISLLAFVLGALVIGMIASPLGEELGMAEAAGDFKTVSEEAVRAAWGYVDVPLWPLAIAALLVSGIVLASLGGVCRRPCCWLWATSLVLGWHVRIAFLPEQTWVQPTHAARAALADVCALPGQDDCLLAPPGAVAAIGYAEPSFVFETGTTVKISPYASTDLAPVEENAGIGLGGQS